MANPKKERWLIIAANANQQWDMGQQKLVSSPTVHLNIVTPGPNGVVTPGVVRQISVDEDDLPNWPPGEYADVVITPPGPASS